MVNKALLFAVVALCSSIAQARIYQCEDGTFSDRPCTGGKAVNTAAAPNTSVWDGLSDPAAADSVRSDTDIASAQLQACRARDYHTRTAIQQGLKNFTIRRCMTMDQVIKVTRNKRYKEYSHINREGGKMVEWVFEEDGSTQRVTFEEGIVVELN